MSKTSMFVLLNDLLRKYNITSSIMKYCTYNKSKNIESIAYAHDIDSETEPDKYVITASSTFVRVDIYKGDKVETHCLKDVSEFVDWCNGNQKSAQERMHELRKEVISWRS